MINRHIFEDFENRLQDRNINDIPLFDSKYNTASSQKAAFKDASGVVYDIIDENGIPGGDSLEDLLERNAIKINTEFTKKNDDKFEAEFQKLVNVKAKKARKIQTKLKKIGAVLKDYTNTMFNFDHLYSKEDLTAFRSIFDIVDIDLWKDIGTSKKVSGSQWNNDAVGKTISDLWHLAIYALKLSLNSLVEIENTYIVNPEYSPEEACNDYKRYLYSDFGKVEYDTYVLQDVESLVDKIDVYLAMSFKDGSEEDTTSEGISSEYI